HGWPLETLQKVNWRHEAAPSFMTGPHRTTQMCVTGPHRTARQTGRERTKTEYPKKNRTERHEQTAQKPTDIKPQERSTRSCAEACWNSTLICITVLYELLQHIVGIGKTPHGSIARSQNILDSFGAGTAQTDTNFRHHRPTEKEWCGHEAACNHTNA